MYALIYDEHDFLKTPQRDHLGSQKQEDGGKGPGKTDAQPEPDRRGMQYADRMGGRQGL
ncbi:MAG: hypothetical protein U5R30_01050 [Deltaproteobacteria bacterium]|nr:hypothetical protein [Deltaproteobacteria bacterium]